jgi:hypothetical protein
VLKPKVSFWKHAAVGLVSAFFVLAITLLITDGRF